MILNNSKKSQRVFFLYACIFIVSLFYRFYGLDKRGYFPRSDSPAYAGLIKTYRAAFDYIVRGNILKHDMGSVNEYMYENGGQFGTVAKDGLIPIGLFGTFIFGDNVNTMLYISGAFGVFTVILLFYILTRFVSPFASFVFSLLLAVSPYHIGFSREGLTVTLSSFFLLAAIYLYIRFLETNNIRKLCFCGLTLGFGFLCHYNIAPFIIIFFAYETYYLIAKRSHIRRILFLSIFSLLPLFSTDIFTRIVKLYGEIQHIKLVEKYNPFFNSLYLQWMQVSGGGSDIHAGAFYYFKNLFYHEGIISSVLLIVSILIILRRGVKADSGVGYFLISVFLFPFFYFLRLQHNIADRAVLNFIPLWYFIIGYGLKNLDKHKTVIIFAVVASIFINAAKTLDYFNYRSNFEQAINYMKQNKGVKNITVTSDYCLSRLYSGRKNVENFSDMPYLERLVSSRKVLYQINPIPLDKLKSLCAGGYNYLVLDMPPLISSELTEAAMTIKPEFSTDIMICNDRGDGYDYALLRDKKGRYLYHFNVYDLSKVLNAITVRASSR